MKVVVFFFIFSMLNVPTFLNAKNHDKNQTPQQIFSSVASSVFQLKTAVSQKGPKVSYGSSFVIDKKRGLLITNYHVVASALTGPEKYKLFLERPYGPIPVTVIGFDLAHDLALVKVEEEFHHELKLNLKELNKGDRIFSLGLPQDLDFSIIEGTYNGIIQSGPYSKILMSSPINSGMSGGPTVDKNGDVIGVNVAILLDSQNISFSVPVKYVEILIKQHKEGKEIKSVVKEESSKQLTMISQKLVEDMIQRKETGSSQINNWSFDTPSRSLKCWLEDLSDKRKSYDLKRQGCLFDTQTYIKDGLYFGHYNLEFYSFKNKKRNRFQFYGLVDQVFGDKSFKNYSSLAYEGDQDITNYKCQDGVYENSSKLLFKYYLCIQSYVQYPNLFNFYIKMASLNFKDEAFVFVLNFEGIESQNIMKVIDYQIEKIKYESLISKN